MRIEEIPLNSLEIHELALSTPAMNDNQYTALLRSLEENGQLEPIRLYRGKVVDGRHRVKALRQLGKETIVATYENPNQSMEDIQNKVIYGWENRRHQSPTQKAISAYYEWTRLKELGEKVSQGEIAEKMGTSRRMLARAKKLDELASPVIMGLLFNGGKVNIGTKDKPIHTDSLMSIINYFKSRAEELMESSQESSTNEDFTDDELEILKQKADELRAELGSRMVKKLSNILFREE